MWHPLSPMNDLVETSPAALPAPLSALAARVLGCLMEKEFVTPDIYPLSLNALTNACNQKSNREPLMSVSGSEVELALEELRKLQLATAFQGADSRVQKFKHKWNTVFGESVVERALLCELLVRGPQTTAGLRGNAERLAGIPEVAECEELLVALSQRSEGALVGKLARQPGQKEARWAHWLSGEPVPAVTDASNEPVTVTMALPPEVERRLESLESEVGWLRAELLRLKEALGEA